LNNKSIETEYYLAVDYGKAKIGLAIADSETRIAFGYGALKNDKEFYANLGKIIKDEKISKVIIGIPTYKEKKESCYDGEGLGEYLRNNLEIEVEFFSEMFSTKMAQENLKEKGAKNLNLIDDEEAARIILGDWLNFGSR
jgi:putative transcription antitermination factor YqgF